MQPQRMGSRVRLSEDWVGAPGRHPDTEALAADVPVPAGPGARAPRSRRMRRIRSRRWAKRSRVSSRKPARGAGGKPLTGQHVPRIGLHLPVHGRPATGIGNSSRCTCQAISVDLHAFPMQRLDHDVATIGAASRSRSVRSHARLTEITEAASASDADCSGIRPCSMQRCTANGSFGWGGSARWDRIAHFFCELACSASRWSGLAKGGQFTVSADPGRCGGSDRPDGRSRQPHAAQASRGRTSRIPQRAGDGHGSESGSLASASSIPNYLYPDRIRIEGQ